MKITLLTILYALLTGYLPNDQTIQDMIIGKWETTTEQGLKVEMVFFIDGTMTYKCEENPSINSEGKYDIPDNKHIHLDFKEGPLGFYCKQFGMPMKHQIQFKSTNELIMVTKEGITIQWRRIKE
jgi:hypothetical protein